jgi:sigma-70-like protein
VTRTLTSLERGVGEAGETELGELLPSDDLGPEQAVEIGLRQEQVRGAVERLPEPERDVIRLRYGIDNDEPTPLREASRQLGMSPESVRRLERAALRRLAESREVARPRRGGLTYDPANLHGRRLDRRGVPARDRRLSPTQHVSTAPACRGVSRFRWRLSGI